MMPVKSEFGGLSLNECILRASKLEDMMTYCSAFNASTSSEGSGKCAVVNHIFHNLIIMNKPQKSLLVSNIESEC